MNQDFEIVDPSAESIVESLRAIGYQLETAIADIIDNSLAVNSRVIKIDFYWKGTDSYVRVEDDGTGMTEDELVRAMRLGSKSPLDERSKSDLGRFGMGLKTASFSQCRRLSVRSRTRDSSESIRCWDLDLIQKKKKWTLLKSPFNHLSEKRLGNIPTGGSGTIVLWEIIDRFIDKKSTDERSYNAFLRQVERVEKHIGMVFHRYLSRPNPVKILLNGRRVVPWDPFLTKEPATQELSPETYADGTSVVTIQPYVLPHHSKISREVYEYAEGTNGWNDHQGFYIYRNQRLLVAGSWFNLFRKEDAYKLARIKVDITSDSDFIWNIDVKKAFAKPPEGLVEELKRVGRLTRVKSHKVYYHRGTKVTANSSQRTFVWQQIKRHGQSFYKINREHPIINSIIGSDDKKRKVLDSFLSLIEETLPSNLVMFSPDNDSGDSNEIEIDESRIVEVRKLLQTVVLALKSSGNTSSTIRHQVMKMEPFYRFPELISEILGGHDSDE
ncbi:ATP-binding protein [Tumebacillus avium]|uniref:ATP-binding protein n=1 Tax=Tumebacillus avium TaxID=1903704 RepID=UPI0012FDA18B|nr:ATP-binding protein [Tumebacillus avium]